MNDADSREKAVLRCHMKKVREELGVSERARIDRLIARRVASAEPFSRAQLVLSYLSVGAEVDTRILITEALRQGKTVACPRCVPSSRTMEWHLIEDFDNLKRNSFGIEEPIGDDATLITPKAWQSASPVALVPGLAFDAYGHRLGYGGGYYDTFLCRFTGTSMGLCRSAQFSRKPLPQDPHDVPVNIVITENEEIIAGY